jgi:bacterioferritin (cytochrome b1)
MNAAWPRKFVKEIELARDPARETCFHVVHTDEDMQGWPDTSLPSRQERLHRHMNNEVGALEIAAQCLVDFKDTPWDLKMQLARQASDESRHAAMLLRRLRELDGFKGQFPIANFEWSVTTMLETLPGRLAVQNRTFEAGLIDLLGSLRIVWRDAGDQTTADLLDGILADEIGHVRFANRWLKRLTEENPRVLLAVAMAVRYLARVNAALLARPGDVNASGVPFTEQRLQAPSVNVEGRLEAEFTEGEVLEVLRQAGFRSILPTDLKAKLEDGHATHQAARG